MKTSEQGLKLIMHYEGERLQPYLDQTGVCTVGYGHALAYPNGEWIRNLADVPAKFKNLDEQGVKDLLASDLISRESDLNSLPLTFEQYQFDSLMDFVFNEGFGALENSTLLKSMKNEDSTPIEDCFMMWNKIEVNGKHIADSWQTARRKTEAHLYLTGELKFYA